MDYILDMEVVIVDNNTTTYAQYCPITRALELTGDRWTLLIIRDMVVGATRFNDLARGLPGLSRSLLTKRLRHLERTGLVDRLDGEYLLTPAGRALEPVVMGLADWGATWAFGDPDPAELDAELLVWWMHARLDVSGLPGDRHVLHVRFVDDARLFWIVVDRSGPSVCLADPGFPVDLSMTSDVSSLYQVWLGRLPLRQALRSGSLTVQGASAWTRRLSTILRLSPIAPVVAGAGTRPCSS